LLIKRHKGSVKKLDKKEGKCSLPFFLSPVPVRRVLWRREKIDEGEGYKYL